MRTFVHLIATVFLFVAFEHTAAGQSSRKPQASKGSELKPLMTFVELGSVKCIPCRQMQPVMKAIEEKYGHQIKVVFYDVWTDAGRPYAEQFKIQLIPTQVFLNVKGAEVFRHEGFFPEADIDTLLRKNGLNIVKAESK